MYIYTYTYTYTYIYIYIYIYIQLFLSIYCLCRSVCQYVREDPVVGCMSCYEWFQQEGEKLLRKVFTNKAANCFCKGCC